jgi:O-antigen/teichoic acid export membrane protein
LSKGSLKSKTISGLLTMSTSSAIVFVIQFITTLILARIFSPEQFGVISAVTIITSYTDIFWMMGIGPALIQKAKLSNHDIRTGFTVSFGFGIICFILMFILSPFLTQFINIDEVMILRVIALSFIINSFGVVPLSLLQKEMRFKTIIVKDVISAISYGCIAIILGIYGLGVWALVFALLTKYIISTAVAWYACPTKLNFGFRKESFKSLVHFGGGYTISRFFSVTASQGDYFVITRTMGAYSLGIYNKAYQLIAIPANLIGQVIDQVFFPAMSKIQNENKRLSDIFIFSTSALCVIYLPLSILIYLFSDEIVIFLLGSQWVETSTPLKLLALFMFFRVGYKISDPIFRAKGAVYNRAAIQLVYATMVVAFSFVGSPWGLKGITLGVAGALVFNYIILTVITHRLIGFKIGEYIRCVIPIMLVTLFITPVMSYIKSLLNTVLSNEIMAGFLLIIILSSWISLSVFVIYLKVWPQSIKAQINRLVLYFLDKFKKRKRFFRRV